MVGNLPCVAGDTSLISGGGTRIPHATEQISPRAALIPQVRVRESVATMEDAT